MWRFAADITSPMHIQAVVEVDAHRDSVLALVGPNGAGKSTLLRAWAGFLGGQQGDLSGPPWQRPLVWVPQTPTLLPHRTVRNQVEWVLKAPLGSRPDLIEWADELGVHTVMDLRPGQLSGGQQQRAALLRALAADPVILALDEALNQIDPPSREQIMSRLAAWADEQTDRLLVVTTHQFSDVSHLASQVLVMDEGIILGAGSPGEIVRSPKSWAVASLVGYTALLKTSEQYLAVLSSGVRAMPPGIPYDAGVVRCDGDGAVVRLETAAGREQHRVEGTPGNWGTGDLVTVYVDGTTVEV
jgi:ABC-type Fe3+/spermidine/putrescine transport system ATPase subunit